MRRSVVVGMAVAGVLLAGAVECVGTITIDGTAAQRSKIANWLTMSLGATVSVDSSGKLSIASGGNASATRLRDMINDSSTSVTLKVVNGSASVFLGAWQSSTASAKGKSTGTQLIDIADLEGIGNVLNSYGFTPDYVLMHEAVEVYEGKKGGLSYEDAHKHGITAEIEEMAQHKTSWVAPRTTYKDGCYYMKIKRPDGSYVVVRLDPSEASLDLDWFKEKVPCQSDKGLIAISDPDPVVHILEYESDLEHAFVATWDEADSMPTGVAFDAAGRLYAAEDLEGVDEIRIFNAEGELIDVLRGEELINPQGLDVDADTGEIFVAAENRVLRYSPEGDLLGEYAAAVETFLPTDVAVWRNRPNGGLWGDGSLYDIFVTDRATGQVFRFHVEEDMGRGADSGAFGEGWLDVPEGVYVDAWWTVWVASTGNHRIYRFTPDGELEPYGDREFFVEDEARAFYDMVAVDFDGVYVVDGTRGAGALLLYDFDGNRVAAYGTGTLQCPTSVAARFDIDTSNLVEITPESPPSETPATRPWLLIALGVLALAALIGVLLGQSPLIVE